MTEREEVALAAPRLPASYTFDDCLRQTRIDMPGESEVVISNVAWARYQLKGDTP